jgi:hypothetical protein
MFLVHDPSLAGCNGALMAVEPPRKITGTTIIRREEGTGSQQKKKQQPRKDEPRQEPTSPGKVDIKI